MFSLFIFGWKNARFTMMRQFCLVFTLSLFEGIGLLFVIPLLSLTSLMPTPETGLLANLSTWLSSWGITHLSLISVLFLYACATGTVSSLRALNKIGNSKLQFGLERTLRSQLYTSLLQANYAYLKHNKPSEWAGLLTTQIARFSYSFGQLINIISSIILLLIFGVMMTLVSWQITVVVVCIITCISIAILPFQRKIKQGGQNAYLVMLSFQEHILQYITTLKQVKAMAQESTAEAQFQTNVKRIEKEELIHSRIHALSTLIYDFIGIISLSLIVVVCHLILKLPLDGLLLILVFCARILPKVGVIFDQTHRIYHSLPGFIVLTQKIAESTAAAETISDKSQALPFKKAMVMKRAQFIQGKKMVLNDVSLTVKPGETIGIVGPSGAGKTTLIDGLSGLVLPIAGTLSIDGVTLTTKNARQWRFHLGYMDQNPQLYIGTILENLQWGNLKAHTETQIWKVLRSVNAADFIKALPNGLQTQLQEFGQNLSGGERQRLCLARLLLKDASVLILDEAMNHLDVESKAQLNETLAALKGKVTIFMISHDERDLANADHIWKVKKGRVLV